MSEVARNDPEFVVDQPLADWLEHHGYHVDAGQRVRLQVVPRKDPEPWPADWSGSFRSGHHDLGRRAKEIIRAEYGRRSGGRARILRHSCRGG